jgi:RNA polymerase sigma-54 factor
LEDHSDNSGDLSSDTTDSLDTRLDGSDWDWESYLESASDSYLPAPREEKTSPSFENFLSKPGSLSEHLLLQLHISTADEELIEIGDYVIGNLDENGYLTVSADEVAAEMQVCAEAAGKAISLIQSFDPPGIAARDLKECLMLQLKNLDQGESIAFKIVSQFLGDLQEKRWSLIAEGLGVSLNAVKEAVEHISSLDPKPARSFSTEDPQYIVPDVFIHKIEEDYLISLNDDGLPRLRISPYYRDMVRQKSWDNPEARDYIGEKMRQAIWLIRSMGQRQRTLYKVAESLVRFQRRFLDDGIRYLRPLTLREVAEDISMHESTVSRITTNKYVHTPQGIFELKYFFHRGLSSQDGEMVSSVNVKEQLRGIIREEGSQRPISDQKLARILEGKGIHISRRTIAKYRAQLKIPSSSRRRRL